MITRILLWFMQLDELICLLVVDQLILHLELLLVLEVPLAELLDLQGLALLLTFYGDNIITAELYIVDVVGL